MSKVQVMDHPLIQHKINYIRNEEVGSNSEKLLGRSHH